jgi:peptide/nickel transport system ATP-binding protein
VPPLLETRRLRKVFRTGGLAGSGSETVALADLSLSLSAERPCFIALAGESGSGKTTIARLLLGLAAPSSGQVLHRDKDLQQMSRQDRRAFRREVQAIFQDPFEVYNPFYKVDHLLHTPVARFGLVRSKAGARELIEAALQTVGLRPDETLGRYPHQLSGGQRQRITIARALLLKPRLIIADEPVSMVDASLRATILESLHRLHRDLGIAFLYITHDLTTAYQVSDHLVILYRGAVAEAGTVEQVAGDPQHPYTQELIRSIPAPDPGRAWLEAGAAETVEEDLTNAAAGGCPYVGRCPRAMPPCRLRQPVLRRTAAQRAVACHLYEDAPPLENQDLTEILQDSPPSLSDGARPTPAPGASGNHHQSRSEDG